MTDANQINDALSANYLLVDLEIRSWAGKRTDRAVSDEVLANKGATRDGGKFVKFLLASADAELETVKQMATAVRAFVYSRTVPWSSAESGARRGSRLLGAKGSIEFLKELNQIKREYDDHVSKLASVWDERVAQAKANLSGLSANDKYPTAQEIPELFSISVDMRPVPKHSDFSRINIPAELAEALGQSNAAETVTQLNNAMDDLRERLLKELARIGTQMQKVAVGDKTRLYDSLITNMQELVALTRSMNVTGNPALTKLADDIETKLLQRPVSAYKNNQAEAAMVANAAHQLATEAAMEAVWNT